VRTKTFEVVMKDGREVVEGPYVAETFPVSVEEQYVVVEV
jgi:3-phenylpropionate/trans-cinnamate dioxygenase ferredoxin subunit